MKTANVIRMMGTDRERLQQMKWRKTSYLGHIYKGTKYQNLQVEVKEVLDDKTVPASKNVKQWIGVDTHTFH